MTTMLRYWQGVVLVGLTLTLVSGCAGPGKISGKGEFTESSYSIGGVEALEFNERGTVTLIPSDRSELVVRAQSNIMDVLRVDVSGNQLTVDTTGGTDIARDTRIDYDVYLDGFREVSLLGSFTLKGDGVTASSLTLDFSGAVDTDLTELSVDELIVSASGSSDLTLAGSAFSVTVTSSGSLDLFASELEATEFRLSSSGSSSADVRVTDQLSVSTSGSASVRYHGQPRVTQSTAGSATVKSVE